MTVNIELLRYALGLNRQKFCEANGIDRNHYKNYACGNRVFPLNLAIPLAQKYGFSLDWFYLGDGEVRNDSLKAVIEFRKKHNEVE